MALDHLLVAYQDPVPILNTFARDYQTGNIAPGSHGVRSRTVEDAVRSIGQAIAMLGAKNPRMTPTGNLDGRLQLQFRCYSRQDPPPSWVKPIPVQVLRRLACIAEASRDPKLQAIADMIIITFFFLLRPGEYTGTKSDSSPFRLSDVRFSVGCTVFDTSTATDNDLAAASFVILTFTTHKNACEERKSAMGPQGTPYYAPRRPCAGA